MTPASYRTDPRILVGLPYSTRGALFNAAQSLLAPALISAGSCYRKKTGLRPPGDAAWLLYGGASLDSAGFTAMRKGGYRWSVDEYVDFIVQGGTMGGTRPFCWSWWSVMDYCCEKEIAANRAEVERRIDATISSLGETLACVDDWHNEGAEGLPDPLPILQGRTVADYVRCAEGLTRELRAAGRDGLPELVGVGSVCRRQLHGPEGLLPILSGLDRALPSHVRLHLFGVKGDALSHLHWMQRRIASIDSMAWDFAARMDARRAGVSCTVKLRGAAMRDWYTRQVEKLAEADAASRVQLSLFGRAA